MAYSSSLLVLLTTVTLLYVNSRAVDYANQRVTEELEQSLERILRLEAQRATGLGEVASLVASFPELKALLETDEATVRDFFLSYQERNRRAEFLVALDPTGRVIARTDSDSTAPIPDVRTRWIDPVLRDAYVEGLFITEDGAYIAAAVAAEAGGIVFGFILAGVAIDDEFARSLAGNDSEIVIIGDRVLGSTLPAGSIPWRTINDWRQKANSGTPNEILIAGESFTPSEILIGGDDPSILAVVLQSREQAMAPYLELQYGLLVLGLLIAAIGVAGSAVLARTITAPVAKLVEGTKQVAAGNLDYHLDVKSGDEIGTLANSFNAMVDERRRLEHQVQQSQKMEAVGRLAGGVAHDFNNLLTVITGRIEMLLSRLSGNHPMRKDLDLVYDSSLRGAALTRQLLAFSRRQVLQPRILNLNELISKMQGMFQPLIGEDIEVQLRLFRRLYQVKADPGQIEQVVMNLVVNARDAMPDGGTLTITTSNEDFDTAHATSHIEIPRGKYAVLMVGDTGVGMGADVRQHLFEPFFTTKEAGKGTGLGLSTVYGIVQQSGGSIDVISAPNQGATFKIYFPNVAEAETDPEFIDDHDEDVDVEGSETILLVEDDQVVRELVQEVLQSHGYTVLTAADGREALTISEARSDRIDLVLTDVMMPHMTGPELAKRLQPKRPDMRVVFMSGYTDQLRVLFDSNAAFIQKPFRTVDLIDKIRKTLDSPAARMDTAAN